MITLQSYLLARVERVYCLMALHKQPIHIEHNPKDPAVLKIPRRSKLTSRINSQLVETSCEISFG